MTGWRLLSVLLPLFAGGHAVAQAPLQEGIVKPLDLGFRITASTRFPGLIHRIHEPGAAFLRLKFDGIENGSNLRFELRVVSRSGDARVYSSEALSQMRSFWTPVIHGDLARVEIAGEAVPEGFSFRIAEVAVQQTPAVKFNTKGANNVEAIKVYKNEAEICSASRAVGKLSFIRDSQAKSCTGFLIADDLLLTNQHCVDSAEICTTTWVAFGYEETVDGFSLGTQIPCIQVVAVDCPLDMAVLRLEGSPGAAWGKLELTARAPIKNEQAFLIHHPGGEPKQITRYDCLVTTVIGKGRAPDTDLGHECDSADGSSGAPLLGHDYKVIGLHHWGFDIYPEWADQNRAVRAQLILDRLRVTHGQAALAAACDAR